MRGSLTLGRIAGIRIAVHWTFLLLVAWVIFIYVQQGETLLGAMRGVGLLAAVFACIVLHELGHALTARRFGIQTRDITLLPIGGVARLQRTPEHPTQELLVAVGGPVVTAVLAALLFAAVLLTGSVGDLFQLQLVGGNFLAKLAWVNTFLLLFNLLPAFPMDGGRMFRAVLHYEMDYVKATRIAATVGQAMAFGFGILGLFSFNVILIIIAFFVYLGASAEARMVEQRAFTRGVAVRDVMVTQFRVLSPDATLADAVEALIAGEQQDFPVVENDEVVGMLTRDELIKGLEAGKRDRPVREVMRTDCAAVDEQQSLDEVFQRMRGGGCTTVPVRRNGHIVGMITLENIGEWIMIRSALQSAGMRATAGQGKHRPTATPTVEAT